MTLNIFTHPIKNPTIASCLKSYREQFGSPVTVHVWKDGLNTTGLADGYITAVEKCADDYIFMLEHDWEFVGNIGHTLTELTDLMRRDGLVHLRFNKRSNQPKLYDKWLKEKDWYCQTPFVSNNPHIIDRKAYLGFIEKGWIRRRGGAKGVEEIISNHIDGAIYGKLDHPATINHMRGR